MPAVMRTLPLSLATVFVLALSARAGPAGDLKQAKKRVAAYAEAVEKLNRDHRRKPTAATEAELAKRLPKAHKKVLPQLLALEPGPDRAALLLDYGKAAADLDRIDDLEAIEKGLAKEAPASAEAFGLYISRPRFLLHAVRVDRAYAMAFADVVEGVLEAYDDVFGFAEFSKVPGKKIRIELHREARPLPPKFAPQFPYHSTVDFPIVKDSVLRSPTPDGRFLFYGLCHELGHLIAMWGDRKTEEDHHAWAHYTGIVIVEACAKARFAKGLGDKRWRSLSVEQKKQKAVEPSTASREGVLKLLFELHDLLGPRRIGEALNHMDAEGMGHRINAVRYYGFRDLEKALLSLKLKRKQKKQVKALLAAD